MVMHSIFSISSETLCAYSTSLYISLKDLDSRLSSPHFSSEVVNDCLVYETRLQSLDYLFFEDTEPCLLKLLTALQSIRLSLIAGRLLNTAQKANFSSALNSYYRVLLNLFPFSAGQLTPIESIPF